MTIELRVIKFINHYIHNNRNHNSSIIDQMLELNYLKETDDGTYTISSEDEKELMHSRMGALTESFHKFAIPSQIDQMNSPKLLDLCSGLGYNSLAALIHNSSVSIHMVEFSKEIIFLSQFLDLKYEEFLQIKNSVRDFFKRNENDKIGIFCEDARIFIQKQKKDMYDLVYHDAFSPTNDPVLYTVDFLKCIYEKIKFNGALFSYSSSIPFRSALVEAGFFISSGPSIGRKRGITIACKDEKDRRLAHRIPLQDELLIALTPTGIPFFDRELNNTSESIKYNREVKREILRNSEKYISTKRVKKSSIDQHFLKIQMNSKNSRESILKMKEFYKFE